MKEMSLDDIKSTQLGILKEVSSFCEDNNITYFLGGGTLLGAIRHKGYIPWDDDIDILMPRTDYDRFLRTFNDNIGNEMIQVSANEIDRLYHHTIAKVSDYNTCLIERYTLNYPLGVNIEIFPLDGLPHDLKDSNKLFNMVGFLRKLHEIKRMEHREGRNIFKSSFLIASKLVLCFINIEQLIEKISTYSKRCCYEESAYVGCVVAGYGKRERMSKEVFKKSIDVEFEGFIFKAPIGYDDYLTGLYGNYMQLPPKEKRVSHHSYKSYWKEEEEK